MAIVTVNHWVSPDLLEDGRYKKRQLQLPYVFGHYPNDTKLSDEAVFGRRLDVGDIEVHVVVNNLRRTTKVSRKHFRVRVDSSGQFYVKNLSITNPIYVNAKPVAEGTELPFSPLLGQVIYFGEGLGLQFNRQSEMVWAGGVFVLPTYSSRMEDLAKVDASAEHPIAECLDPCFAQQLLDLAVAKRQQLSGGNVQASFQRTFPEGEAPQA